jgi:hypothetical protein
MKNNSENEKTQKPKRQGVIANSLSFLIYRKTRSSFFKTGGFNRSTTSSEENVRRKNSSYVPD